MIYFLTDYIRKSAIYQLICKQSDLLAAFGVERRTDLDRIFGIVELARAESFAHELCRHGRPCAVFDKRHGAVLIVAFGKIFNNFALRMLSVVFGAILYFVVIAVVLWLGLETTDLKLISALIVALFLAVPYLQGRCRIRRAGKGA